MGNNPSCFSAKGGGKDRVTGMDTDDFPVECVSWEDAQAFLDKLAALRKEQEAGRKYRLPTEAEWEYACRGGGTEYTTFHVGNSLSSTQANFDGNYPYGSEDKGPYLGRTSKVGSYRPNGFGLYDMHGNVWEWCSDWYDAHYFPVSLHRNPQGPLYGALRVLRGGCWSHHGHYCRSACRGGFAPAGGGGDLGIRVAVAARIESREVGTEEGR
jgi:formylglycine-generating enzyme required for sulfatase activity